MPFKNLIERDPISNNVILNITIRAVIFMQANKSAISSPSDPELSPRISMFEKVGYGLGDTGINLYLAFFNFFLLYYYTDIWGIHPGHVATLFLLTRVFDAITDPLVGMLSDRTQTRWGRYRPYILWFSLPLALFACALFWAPDLSGNGKLIYAYVTYSLVMMTMTLVHVPMSAILSVIHPSSEERVRATQVRVSFGAIGGVVAGATIMPLVLALGQGDMIAGFRQAMLVFAAIALVMTFTVFFVVRERVSAPPKQSINLSEDFGILLRNVSWIVLVVTGFFAVMALITRFASIAFYSQYYLGTGEAKILWWMDGTSMLLTFGYLGMTLGALSVPRLLEFFEKKHLLMLGCGLAAVFALLGFFVPPSSYTLSLVVHVISIYGYGLVFTLLFLMYTDCTEFGDWKFGKNIAALTTAAGLFSLKAGSSVGAAIPAAMLAVFGFVPAQEQTQESLTGIRLMYAVVPCLCFLLAMFAAKFYQIDRVLLAKIESELAERRSSY
jgi:GPH family glycoside/pentoside/hexuronide:cation symporter